MKSKPKECALCPLATVTHFDKGRLVTNHMTGWVDPEGIPELGVTFVGEAAGSNEEQAGLPFRADAQAGSILERVFRRVGISRSQVKIGNILSCRPPNNLLSGERYEEQSITCCAGNRDKFLRESIDYVASMRLDKLVITPEHHHYSSMGGDVTFPATSTLVHAPRQHVTVALGGTAFRTLTGLSGDKLGIERARGYPVMTDRYGLVIGTYHPAFIARKRKFFGVLLEDVITAFRWAKDGFTEHPRHYLTHPTDQQVTDFVRTTLGDPNAVISWDIETDPSMRLNAKMGEFPKILSVQFSTSPGTGIFLRMDNPYHVEAIRLLLASPNTKIGHNIWDFDELIVMHWGFVINGLRHDSLWMFHHYQPDITIEDMSGTSDGEDDLRLSTAAGLQYTASFCGMDFLWKHYNNTNPEFYGIADVDACSRIWTTLPQKMRNLGVWEGYLRHVLTMKPILDKAAERGIWFDLDGRDKLHKELSELTFTLDGTMQSHHPDGLKRLDPVNGFVREPVEGDKIRRAPARPLTDLYDGGYTWEWLDDSTVEEGEDSDPDMPLVSGVWRPMVQRLFQVTQKTLVKQCACTLMIDGEPRFGKMGKPLKPKQVPTYLANCKLCLGAGRYYDEQIVTEKRWARQLPFKPSNKQLINYIKFKGYKVPHDHKTKKATTNAKKIQELAAKTRDPLFQTVLDIRTVQKIDSTYVTGQWIPTRSFDEYYDGVKRYIGIINTKFTTAPATGQKSSRGPNIQNCFPGMAEILTPSGWTRFDALLDNTPVAQFDEKTQVISFVVPSEVIRAPHSDNLVHIQTEEQIDLLVTKAHECLLQNRKTGKFYKVAAKDYSGDALQWQAGNYIGGLTSWRWSQVTLVAALQADGHVMKGYVDGLGRRRGEGGHLDFSFNKIRKIDRFRTAINAEGIPHTERREQDGGTSFYISRVNIPDWLTNKKFFGPWILELDKASFQMMADELFLWDGLSTRKTNYASKEKANTDWAQILMSLTNRRAHMRLYTSGGGSRSWQIDVAPRMASSTANHSKTQMPYTGLVYCVTVPTGNIVTRYNNRVTITGNSPKHVRNENLRHLDLAKRFRSLMVAPPNHYVVEFDMKSAHAKTLGFEAEDASYMRLADIDVHSYMASMLLTQRGVIQSPIQLGVSDSDLKAALKDLRYSRHIKKNGVWQRTTEDDAKSYGVFKRTPDGKDKLISFTTYPFVISEEVRDTQAKPAILGYGFGLGGTKLYEMNKESFDNTIEAQEVLNLIDIAFPKLKEYRDRKAMQAHNQHYLVTRGGAVRWFWDVFHFKYNPEDPKKWKVSHGTDYEDAIALEPANDAFVHIDEAMIILDEQGWLEKAHFINTVHDSLIFLIHHDMLESAVEAVVTAMEAPSKVLINSVAPNGLVIGVDWAKGPDWGNLK